MEQHTENEINFLETEYNKILSIENIWKNVETDIIKHFKLKKRDEDFKFGYLNPLRYERIREPIQKVRDNIITTIIYLFHKEFPNTPLDSKDFEDCIINITNEYGHTEKGLGINFDRIKLKIKEFEKDSNPLALDHLMKMSLKLIPYELKGSYGSKEKRKFLEEEINKGKKLVLWCGYSYEHPNKEYIPYFLRLVNVILNNEPPSKAEGYSGMIYFKYYKNGRLDVEFSSKEDTEKIAKYLETNQDVN